MVSIFFSNLFVIINVKQIKIRNFCVSMLLLLLLCYSHFRFALTSIFFAAPKEKNSYHSCPKFALLCACVCVYLFILVYFLRVSFIFIYLIIYFFNFCFFFCYVYLFVILFNIPSAVIL